MREPTWKVLFSNVSDKDGGQITTALQQMNVPYELSSGGTIAVPAEKVYETRLKLATQGLPKASGVGFELMDNQKFGISQFAEQVNYQRSIEGELARTIQALSAVESARVHLAIPKNSVFLREQQKPTASVVLNLNSGRLIDPTQIHGIMNLVASAVPGLPPRNITIVDQEGNMLSTMWPRMVTVRVVPTPYGFGLVHSTLVISVAQRGQDVSSEKTSNNCSGLIARSTLLTKRNGALSMKSTPTGSHW